jgi:hypothetical protein
MKDDMYKALAYIAARLKEPSTYPAFMLLVSSIGHWASADTLTQQQVFMDAGLFLAGLIGAVLPDRMGKNSRVDDKPEGETK